MREIEPLLMEFLEAGDMFGSVLTVECARYLPALRERFPSARLFAVEQEDEAAAQETFSGLDVEWHLLDYREERLPFPRESFDAIFCDLALEHVANPQDIASGFSMYLKQTGVLLTSFRNIRHWSVLEQLMRGRYPGIVSRLYAKEDFENLLYACFYKEARMAPVRRDAPPDLLRLLLDAGFENIHDDLETEFWLVRAARSMPELALLKSMYTYEERKWLSRILHRIEYDIDAAENTGEFWRIFDSMGLFPDYAASFIHEAVVHREAFYRRLIAHSPGRREEMANLLAAAIDACMNPDDPVWLAKLLEGMGEPLP